MHDDMHSGGGGNCVFLLIQSTPRKGTETLVLCGLPDQRRDTIYTPQGDGNGRTGGRWERTGRDTIYTPQGDGNALLTGVSFQQWIQSTPRKGTETIFTVNGRIMILIQSTPRKGTETGLLPLCPVSEKIQSTPRKGTETGSRYLPRDGRQIQSTPRKGTETLPVVMALRRTTGYNLHPARGRKPPNLKPMLCPPRYNLHPARGRKLFCHQRSAGGTGYNLHPARGRKPIVSGMPVESPGYNLHPARGRKLVLLTWLRPAPARYNLHPARGRKQDAPAWDYGTDGYNLHPARGRKPPASDAPSCNPWIQSTPRKGTETWQSGIACLPRWIQSTPRKGTETGDRRNDGGKLTRYNLHPARGRKPQCFPRCYGHTDTIYTPQGDGNLASSQLVQPCADTIYTPQGDGNLEKAGYIKRELGYNLHPARGRKPVCICISY